MKRPSILLLLAALAAAGCSRVPPEEALARGQAALAAGRWDEAAALLDAAADAHPENPVVFYNLGMARLCAGKWRGARAAFAESAKFAAGDDRRRAVQGLAEAWRRGGDADKALEVYTEAIDGGDRSACLLAGLAGIELERGELQAAHRHLSEAAADDPDDPTYLFNSGWLFSTDEKLDVTVAAERLVSFVTSGDNAALYPAQADAARRRLAELSAKRPAALQEKIDTLLERSLDPSVSRTAAAFKAAVAAYQLDQSNSFALETVIDLARRQGRRDVAAALATRGRLLFPDEPAFRE
ncbi:MAG: tetratricopeptide repeat protein [Kiritimatiellae bacterium]|nr:tetratricopeptide repeat protein [Kiritimatiellia bacterium]